MTWMSSVYSWMMMMGDEGKVEGGKEALLIGLNGVSGSWLISATEGSISFPLQHTYTYHHHHHQRSFGR